MSNLVPASDLPQEASKLVPEHDLPTDYESTGQQIKTGLEGFGQGLAGPLSTAAETQLLGVKPEDMLAREQANPGIHGLGEAAGLAAGMAIPGVGEYSLGSKVAQLGAGAAKIAENQLAKAAIRTASEMALIQASDEMSHWIQNDPNQTIQSAISHIGLSAALGGVGGAAFSKAGSVIKGLSKSEPIEEVLGGLKTGLDPIIETSFKAPNSPKVSSEGIGSKIAQAIKDHASEAGIQSLGGSIGGAIGHAIGIPGGGWAGAYLGKEHLSPILKSIIPALGKKVMDLELNPMGFATSINMAEAALKGRIAVEKAANSVFSGGYKSETPMKSDLNELDAKVKQLHNNVVGTSQVLPTDLAHYTPDHAVSMGQTVGQVIQYLAGIRPIQEKKLPLDPQPKINPITQAAYQNALSIAQQPLMVLSKIHNGRLTSPDVIHLKSMYPALYSQMQTALMNGMTDHLSKNKEIPYHTRLGVSLFMGQPMDSTMTPMSIQSTMMLSAMKQQSQQMSESKGNKLDGLASMDATTQQSRQLKKAKS